jgi:hypothetical protein
MSRVAIPDHLMQNLGSGMKMDVHSIANPAFRLLFDTLFSPMRCHRKPIGDQ